MVKNKLFDPHNAIISGICFKLTYVVINYVLVEVQAAKWLIKIQ